MYAYDYPFSAYVTGILSYVEFQRELQKFLIQEPEAVENAVVNLVRMQHERRVGEEQFEELSCLIGSLQKLSKGNLLEQKMEQTQTLSFESSIYRAPKSDCKIKPVICKTEVAKQTSTKSDGLRAEKIEKKVELKLEEQSLGSNRDTCSKRESVVSKSGIIWGLLFITLMLVGVMLYKWKPEIILFDQFWPNLTFRPVLPESQETINEESIVHAPDFEENDILEHTIKQKNNKQKNKILLTSEVIEENAPFSKVLDSKDSSQQTRELEGNNNLNADVTANLAIGEIVSLESLYDQLIKICQQLNFRSEQAPEQLEFAVGMLTQMMELDSKAALTRQARTELARSYLKLARELREKNAWQEADNYVEKALGIRMLLVSIGSK